MQLGCVMKHFFLSFKTKSTQLVGKFSNVLTLVYIYIYLSRCSLLLFQSVFFRCILAIYIIPEDVQWLLYKVYTYIINNNIYSFGNDNVNKLKLLLSLNY